MIAEQLTAPVAWHGEGPCWDQAGGRMLVVDMLAGAVVDVTVPGSPVRHELGEAVVAALRPRRGGGFVVAAEHGFLLLDPGFELERRLPEVVEDAGIRLNEGGCDPAGRFFCGSMAYEETPDAAALYRLEPDGTSALVLDGVTISNGLQWSLDGALAYYIDSATRRVDVFDYDVSDGGLRERRPLAELGAFEGLPDGMAIDAEGGLWVAQWGGGIVRRLDPGDGGVTAVVEVPGVTHTSACAFGGEDLGTLYITSSRQHLPEGAEPQAGAVFAVRPGVHGAPLPRFAG